MFLSHPLFNRCLSPSLLPLLPTLSPHPLPPQDPSLPSLFCALRIFAHLKSFLPPPPCSLSSAVSQKEWKPASSPAAPCCHCPRCPCTRWLTRLPAAGGAPPPASACSPLWGAVSGPQATVSRGISGKTGTTQESSLPILFLSSEKGCSVMEQVSPGPLRRPYQRAEHQLARKHGLTSQHNEDPEQTRGVT